MSKLSTKDLDDKRISKVLQPGNHKLEIVMVKLEGVPYKEGAYHINLHVEGPDLGKDFEGFFIDVDDPTKGRYKGQAGRIRCNEFPYSDGETKSGIKVFRDREMMRAIKNLCLAMGASTWFDSQDGKHDTIEEFVTAFNKDKPFKGKGLRMCIGGREYQNKQGYTNYDLHIPKAIRGTYAYESDEISENSSKLMKYDPAIHIKKSTKKVDTVTSFEKPVTEETKNQFSLD